MADDEHRKMEGTSSADNSGQTSNTSSSTEGIPIEVQHEDQVDLLNLNILRCNSIYVFLSSDLLHGISEDESSKESHSDHISEMSKDQKKKRSDDLRSLSEALLGESEKLLNESKSHRDQANELTAVDRQASSSSQGLRDDELPRENVHQSDIQTSPREVGRQSISTSPGKTKVSQGVSGQSGPQRIVKVTSLHRTGSSNQTDSAASISHPSSTGQLRVRIMRMNEPTPASPQNLLSTIASVLQNVPRRKNVNEESRVDNTPAGTSAGPSNQTDSPGGISIPSSSGMSEEQYDPNRIALNLQLLATLAGEVTQNPHSGDNFQSHSSESKKNKEESPVQNAPERSVDDEILLKGPMIQIIKGLEAAIDMLRNEKYELEAKIVKLQDEVNALQAKVDELLTAMEAAGQGDSSSQDTSDNQLQRENVEQTVCQTSPGKDSILSSDSPEKMQLSSQEASHQSG